VTGVADPDGLDELLNERTKLVCFSQTSNLLGDHQDVGAICKLAQRVGATTIVDVVASASHSLPDVADWGVDFAVLSHYKIYGPHLASLWGKNSCWEQLENPNHFFVPKSAGNFELGCLPYELLAGICAYAEYLCSLAGTAECTREAMRSAYKQMKQLESEPQRLLMSYLLGRSDMRVLGPQSVGNERHPTIGFTHTKWSSKQIADLVNSSGFGMKFGNFYAYRLCESLGIDPVDGVARISLVHYNSVEEVERVMKVLDGVG
jgi:selenocysteine lyase/cysteine desulfurase